jgi:hypothetical protein
VAATVADGQQGWFEIQMERSPDGWDWAINHDRRFWGQQSTIEKAKIAAAAQLEQTGQDFPRCEIRRFTENESGGYLMSFPDFPGVVASGADGHPFQRHLGAAVGQSGLCSFFVLYQTRRPPPQQIASPDAEA